MAEKTNELLALLRLGWPNSVRMLLEFLPGLTMLAFLSGDAEEIAAAGMGVMFGNVSGISLIFSTGSGAQPLMSQAFGAKNMKRCGDLLQRQLAMHAALVLLIAALWWNTEKVLLFARQPAATSHLTAVFVRWRLAALPFCAVREDLSNFLVAQECATLPMLASVLGSALNLLLFPVLIPVFGFIGAPLAITFADVLRGVLLLAFTKRVLPDAAAWPTWSRSTACSSWGELLNLALPSAALILCEWWGWESNLFFAGLLCENSKGPCVPLDVFPVAANTMVIGFMTHWGFSIAAGARVGAALGAGKPAEAKRTAHVALQLVAAVAAFVGIALTVGRWRWSALFWEESSLTNRRTARVLPAIGLYIFLDGVGPGALVSIFRAVGVVRFPAAVNFAAFYFVGIPFGLWLTFRSGGDWGVLGLWSGLCVGMTLMVLSLLAYLLLKVDWQEAAKEAQMRSAAPEAPRKAGKYLRMEGEKAEVTVVGKAEEGAVLSKTV